MVNFLSLNETFLISLQGKPIFGVSLEGEEVPFIHRTALILSHILRQIEIIA